MDFFADLSTLVLNMIAACAMIITLLGQLEDNIVLMRAMTVVKIVVVIVVVIVVIEVVEVEEPCMSMEEHRGLNAFSLSDLVNIVLEGKESSR